MTTASPTAKLMVFVSSQLACVKIQGKANFTSSIDFKTLLNELFAKGFTCFVLDLTECSIMDSTFLGVLAGFGMKVNNATNGASIELMNPNPRVADLLDNLGVLHLFRVLAGTAPQQTSENGEVASIDTSSYSREETTRNCLEAHKILMELNPANVSKFKEVTQFLADDLKKMSPESAPAPDAKK